MGQVVSQSVLNLRRGEWKRTGEGVVCVCGAFDLLHPGHIRLLDQARSVGDVLVVALESDTRLRKEHGAARPVIPTAERAEILAALASVDCVVEIDEPPAEFLARLRPDVFVRGVRGDPESASPEDAALESAGCKVVRVPVEPGYSTASLLERITEFRA